MFGDAFDLAHFSMVDLKYYRLLGVGINAPQIAIRKSYLKLAKKYHPDRVTGNADMFKKINEAYKILSGAMPEPRTKTVRRPTPFTGGAFYGDFFRDMLRERGRDRLVDCIVPLATFYTGGSILFEGKFRVNIPRGTKNNTRVTVRGRGYPHKSGGKHGNLLLDIKSQRDHPLYTRFGDNLRTRVKISPIDVANGCVFVLKGMDGKNLAVHTEPKINVDAAHFVPNAGMARSGSGFGSLSIRFDVVEDLKSLGHFPEGLAGARHVKI